MDYQSCFKGFKKTQAYLKDCKISSRSDYFREDLVNTFL